jgi:hypothetical protein
MIVATTWPKARGDPHSGGRRSESQLNGGIVDIEF